MYNLDAGVVTNERVMLFLLGRLVQVSSGLFSHVL